MNPTHWQKVKTIFHTALDCPRAQRAAYLDKACLGDAALRQEVEDLLAAHEETGNFLAQPAVAEAAETFIESTELATGQRVGPYEIQRKIGEGGMGEVYLARDSRLGRLVALKVLRANLTRDTERVRRFQHEARAASALNHPNILTIYEVDRTGELDFIATEYIEGQTLRALLKSGNLTLGTVLDIVTQVGKALETAHGAGIIHRDIKPENLMQRSDGYVKVLDFGLAKLTERKVSEDLNPKLFSTFHTRPGLVMGTVTYMSPEQARGLEMDARTDVFSLGVVLYEMLTGNLPFQGKTTSDVIAAILEHEPRPLDAHISGLPEDFQRIVQRALQKNRELRYPTISAMIDDLHSLKGTLELASNLKRFGKSKSSEGSLLNMTVGHSTVSDQQKTRAISGAAGRTTSSIQPVLNWVKTHRRWVLASVVLLAGLIGSSLLLRSGKVHFEIDDQINSIAVLPFADNLNDAQLSYLPDGLTESLINNLSRLPNLRVMASGTVFTYKGRVINPMEAGKELKVRAVVSGRLQKLGDQLLISVEVADTSDGSRLWGDQYQRPLTDLLTVQNDIVSDIMQHMRGRLSGEQQQQLARRQPANNEAYQLYLKGRYYFAQFTRASQDEALRYFQEAIQADPAYALAYTGVADYYADFSGQYLPPAEAMPKAKAAAQRALELDPTLAEAHHSLAIVQWWGDWDFPAAESEFKRTLELNPNAAVTMAYYAEFLIHLKRTDEALTWAQRGHALDPLSSHISLTIARVLLAQRHYEAALEQSRQTQALNPKYIWSYSVSAQCLSALKQPDAAIKQLQQGLALNRHDSLLTVLGAVYASAGKTAEAKQTLAELESPARQQSVPPVYLARVYTALNDHDRAFQLLRRAYEERSDHLLVIGNDRLFDGLRSDPRLGALLKEMKLP